MIFALIYPIQCLHHAAKSFPMLNPYFLDYIHSLRIRFQPMYRMDNWRQP